MVPSQGKQNRAVLRQRALLRPRLPECWRLAAAAAARQVLSHPLCEVPFLNWNLSLAVKLVVFRKLSQKVRA